MQNPYLSFTSAFLIWLSFVAIFSFSVFKKSEIPQVAIEVDATMFGEVIQEKKIPKNSIATKPDPDMASDVKKDLKENLQHNHHLEDSTANNEAKKLAVLFNPLPKIPDDLREEAFASEALARFYVNPDGSVNKVELTKPCANPRLNNLLLQSLRSWKFSANSVGGTQDIRVYFKVE